MRNIHRETVEGFGSEWSRFDQADVSGAELRSIFETYFDRFPWDDLPVNAEGFDAGCGSGRWAAFVAPRVGTLNCIDASPVALAVAKRSLAELDNCRFLVATLDDMPLDDGSQDFGYSLGVLHHIPDTQAAFESCVRKLKPGAPFLFYLYYAFDHKPWWFKALWGISDKLRRLIARSPGPLKHAVTDLLAATVYWPLARLARWAEERGRDIDHFPLAIYRDKSFYTMRTDALDRFGTRLEKRFTRAELEQMARAAGLEGIRFSESPPYWRGVGVRTRSGPAPDPLAERR